MARAAARERRQARKAAGNTNGAKPRASITVQADLVGAKSGTQKAGYYGGKDSNVVELSFRVKLGAPEKMPSWQSFRQGEASGLRYDLKNRHERENAPPARKKNENDEDYTKRTGVDPKAPKPVAAAFDIEAEIDKRLKPKYEQECARIARKNAAVVQGAQASGIFFALLGSTVRLTVSPQQAGFVEMFETQDPLLLAEGEEDWGDDDNDDTGDDDE